MSKGSGPGDDKGKLTKERFQESFYDIMVEFIADRELLVKIEGIQMFVDYMSFITRLDVEKDFVPHL